MSKAAPSGVPTSARKAKGKRKMDLGPSDVHVPGAVSARPGKIRKGLQMRIHPGGVIDVRHAADREFTVRLDSLELRSEEPAADIALRDSVFNKGTPAKLVWNQLAIPGAWRGHPAGPFELTTKEFSEIERNFNATKNRAVAIDHGHASEAAETSGSLPESGAPAQGWIFEIQNRGPAGLWGLVEWKPDTAEQINKGEFRFFSPAIRFNAKDRVTGQNIGARITSGAITNSPFLDGMVPLAASDRMSSSLYSEHETMPKIRSALQMSETALPVECFDKLGQIREMANVAGPDGMHSGVSLAPYTSALKSMFPMGGTATWDDLFDAVEEMIEAAIAATNPDSPDVVENDDDEGGGDEGAAMADQGTQETTTMSDEAAKKEAAELAIKLKDQEAKLAGESLERKSAEARAEKAEADLKLATDRENTRLLADRAARVEEAFDTYKDAKKLSDADKDSMAVYLATKPESFEKLYPKVNAAERHLLRDLTSAGSKTEITTEETATVVVKMNVRDLAYEIAQQRGIPLGEAQVIAERLLKTRK